MVWLAAARMSVLPSGGALAAKAVPMVLPAPGRFSTITFRPSCVPSSALMARAGLSSPPPAENGTTMRVTPCPRAAKATQTSAAATMKRFNSLLAAFLARRRFCVLLRPIVVRGERVRREHVALRRHHLGGIRALRLVHLLERGALGRVLRRDLVPGLERGDQDVGGRAPDLHAVLVDELLDRVGVLLLQRVSQLMNASFTAESIASCCTGVRLFQTSRLSPSSPIELFSCMPGV